MPDVLLATDADWIFEDVDAALTDEDTDVVRVRAGRDVSPAVRQVNPGLVVLDLQIGNMGGIATALDLQQGFDSGEVPGCRSCCCSTVPPTSHGGPDGRSGLAAQAARRLPPTPRRSGHRRRRHVFRASGLAPA